MAKSWYVSGVFHGFAIRSYNLMLCMKISDGHIIEEKAGPGKRNKHDNAVAAKTTKKYVVAIHISKFGNDELKF